MLPYFDGLITPDQNFLPSIMRRFFIRNFGTDDEAIDKNFRSWKLGHTSIFRTHCGKILAHIFLCLQAALEGQARLFVVQNGRRYLGCAVIGYNFHLTIGGIVKTPETAESLRSLLSSLDPHMQAVGEIVEVLKGLELSAGGMEDVHGEMLESGKAVWRALQSREKAVGDDLKSLRDAVDRLSFEERYLTISKADILRWVRLLSDPVAHHEEIDNLPMYLTGDSMYDTSYEHQVISAFGPMAPSFLNTSGGRFRIPASGTDIDHASIKDAANGDKRPLERILIVGKKVPIAVSDWRKMVKTREVSQNQTQRSSGYKNVAFTESARDEIWDALKTIPPFQKAQKRRREEVEDNGDSDEAEGGKTKRARTRVASSSNMFEDL